MTGRQPQHVAIIMDGNGRWAKARKLPRVMGHRAGSKAVRRTIEYCRKNNIPYLSLFALSVENRQNRPKKEIDFLLALFLESLRKHTAEMHDNHIRVEVIGDRSLLTDALREHVSYTENLTRHNTGLVLKVAIDYSGRWDILQATQKLLRLGVSPDTLTETAFSQHLAFANMPEPDLLIRTGGDQRISNFMLWQCAYTEFYFTDKYWPEFNAAEFQNAITIFQSRERRFGHVNQPHKSYVGVDHLA